MALRSRLTRARATGVTAVALSVVSLVSGCAGAASGEKALNDVAAGECFSTDEAHQLAFIVTCDEPHRYFALDTFELEGDLYPGEDRVLELADETCPAAFRERLGVDPVVAPEWQSSAFVPSAEAWDNKGDRSVICVTMRADASLTSSAPDAAL